MQISQRVIAPLGIRHRDSEARCARVRQPTDDVGGRHAPVDVKAQRPDRHDSALHDLQAVRETEGVFAGEGTREAAMKAKSGASTVSGFCATRKPVSEPQHSPRSSSSTKIPTCTLSRMVLTPW